MLEKRGRGIWVDRVREGFKGRKEDKNMEKFSSLLYLLQLTLEQLIYGCKTITL